MANGRPVRPIPGDGMQTGETPDWSTRSPVSHSSGRAGGLVPSMTFSPPMTCSKPTLAKVAARNGAHAPGTRPAGSTLKGVRPADEGCLAVL